MGVLGVGRMPRSWTLCFAGALLAVVVACANGEDELSPIDLGAAEAIGRRGKSTATIRRGVAVAATAGNFHIESAFMGNFEEEALGEASAPPPADQELTVQQSAALSNDMDLAAKHGIADAMFNYNATQITEIPMSNTPLHHAPPWVKGCSTIFIPQDRSTICGGSMHCSCTSCKPGFAMVPLYHAQKTGLCMRYSSHVAMKCIRPNSRKQDNSPDDRDLLCTKAIQVQTEFWYTSIKHKKLKAFFKNRLNKYPGALVKKSDGNGVERWTPGDNHIGIAVCDIHKQTVCMTMGHTSFCRAKKQVFCQKVCKMKMWYGEDRIWKNSCMPCTWFAGAIACRTAIMTS